MRRRLHGKGTLIFRKRRNPMQQLDFFQRRPADQKELQALTLRESTSPGYRQRTLDNAQGADLTVAFAVDFSTAGERLTRSAAGPRYCAVDFGIDAGAAAFSILRVLPRSPAPRLNLAGNGVHTLKRHGIEQVTANQWVWSVLQKVHSTCPIQLVRSGGQTGIDTAGLVAALALGIPAAGEFPKRFLRRNAMGKDFTSTAADIERELRQAVSRLAPGI